MLIYPQRDNIPVTLWKILIPEITIWIKCIPRHFQMEIDQTLEQVDDIVGKDEDIAVYAISVEKNDKILH